MTPAARLQSAIELLDAIIAAACDAGPAADTVIAGYFKARRYAGSGDRRAIRELVYRAIRRAGERPESGRAALFGLAGEDASVRPLFDGSPHGPAPIVPGEPATPPSLAPAWLAPKLGHVNVAALLERAPLDLRVNTLKASRDDVLDELPGAMPTRFAPHGARLAEPLPIEQHPLWRDGAVEVQDEGSQLIALACRAAAGQTIVDLCAGAGGKTLALAAAMGGEGRLVACDTDRARLSRLPPRAERAGATNIETRLLDPGREAEALGDLAGAADCVLVDAPCSGTGTWRRNPEARWRLTPDRLARLTALQARLVALAATLVRPGGRLIYAVCSLLDEEGADRMAAFLDAHPDWRAGRRFPGPGTDRGAGVLLSPGADGTDGFFVASVESPC
ncbi:RsmB/NOP family class I SAM-dependent RNA methyltransferase [Sphingomonas sp. MAH-20]|uniref:RsmB/NOP family class I SAM-dependent RNA methyltransferase n=1 Tax=Sphingomonas horti TaxID=2682842 RepID=A0A6I4J2Q9_9SPHN|nr:RsmB/NOP family class I SAM-dependent RNA methyltransferase [Sphingomonas sp. CGMCC 1.13658]MBA2919493.1 RsmB/NOP family class I SAM-dependent RNA methyltransferase [Sphingomonas sp. CGMCC 1.13658]MVO78373.1 RsmB/NOP family class I SAM-dependent RNA methyltransferase [Sphingomonas horti]